MDPKAVIESYVDDIVRRLPRRLRNDVGFELRSLLTEELDAKASEAGRPADDAMTLALLQGFGAPEAVAMRYRPAGLLLIEPAQSRAFILWSLGGVALQWALTLPPVFLQPEVFPGQTLSRLGGWWVSFGLGAFWWPGLMVTAAMAAAWMRRRWPAEGAWKPRLLDPDRVNRPGLAVGLAAWTAGAVLVISIALLSQRLPGPLARVFAFDDGFLHGRAPWLLPFWAGHFGLYVIVFAQGRWSALTRRINLGFEAAICTLLVWFLAAGPIFTAKPTNDSAKGCIAVIVLVVLIAAGARLYRRLGRIRPPESLARSPGG